MSSSLKNEPKSHPWMGNKKKKTNYTIKIQFCSYLFVRCSKSSLTCFVQLPYRKTTRLWLQHCTHRALLVTPLLSVDKHRAKQEETTVSKPSASAQGSYHKGPEFWILSLKFWMLSCFSPYTNPNLNFAMIFWGILYH